MELQNFHVQSASWSTPSDRDALSALRLEVFVAEQGVPEALEWDNLDTDSIHVLARDQNGRPIGCGRLTPEHKIGRMAVQAGWRGKGVGAALLRELIARARALGWPDVALDAQVQALDFYAREGFVAEGDVFDDAGIPHRLMRLALNDASDVSAGRLRETLSVNGQADLASARLTVLGHTRYRLAIYQPLLTAEAFGDADDITQLRRIASSGRGASIRILLHDPQAALRDSHRLVTLAQRLPSVISIRVPVDEHDLGYGSAYLLNDAGGYVFQPDAHRPQGRTAVQDRSAQAPLLQHFNEVWERAERATVLQPLDL
jgi:predicted GNAT family N-acyltransferase